jgi:NAD(P)-dependent dehydrogenase (short-subunit alcohol dehydrogenase family)
LRLKDKVAVITGASSGIGRAIAIKFAQEGANVVLGDIRREPREGGEPTDDTINKMREGSAVFVKCDVRNEDEVRNLIETAVKRYSKLDIMVNVAGIPIKKKFTEISAEEALEVFKVNVMGTIYGCKWAIKQFLTQNKGGKIINIASNLAEVSLPEQAVYSASKAAILGLTKGLAVEYGPYGINVVAICPGATKTEFTRPYWATQEGLEELKKRTPLIKDGEFILYPEDIANLAVFLASDEANKITGTCVLIDAGWNAW